jgi:hypothetical protein
MEGGIATRLANQSQYASSMLELETSREGGSLAERKGGVEDLSRRRSADGPRLALAHAQQEREIGREKRDHGRRAVERVRRAIAAIEEDLADFSHVDSAVAEACAASILRSPDSSEELKLEFSPELMEAWEKKVSLEKGLAALRRAEEVLLRELQAAEQSLTEAEGGVANAAIAVAAHEIEPIAAELAGIEVRAAALRRLLLGYGALRHAGGFLPMSRSAAVLLRGEKAAHDPEAAACWSSFLNRLAHDAEAIFAAGSLLTLHKSK